MDGVMYEGVNNGYLCVKGRWGYDYAQSPDRLKQPLIRRGDRFETATWDEALGYIAMRLGEFRDGSFYGVGSTKATNEEAYLFQLFTRVVMGTNNLDSNARYSQAPWQRAFAQSFGLAATTNEIARNSQDEVPDADRGERAGDARDHLLLDESGGAGRTATPPR